MPDMFAKLLHALVTLPFVNTEHGTLTLRVVGNIARLFVYGG